MANNWQYLKLAEVVNIIGGGTPKRSVEEYWGGNIPWLSVKDFNNDYRMVSQSEETITELGLQKSSTKLLSEGQIIISARGTVGELAQVTKPMAFNQSCYGIDAKPEYAINDFVYYLLKNSISNIQRVTHGAVFDTITRDTFNFIEVLLPPLPEQKAIVHILGTLDDKIELNRQMNQTLEAMAQALFKGWFVDFDPVIDNALLAGKAIPEPLKERAEMRQAQLDSGKAKTNSEVNDLFPSEFEFTEELGWIPKGWASKKLGDLLDIKYGKDHKKLEEGNIPVYGSGGLMRLVDKSLYNGESILIPRKGTLSNLMYVNEEFWTVDTMFYSIPKQEKTVKYLFQCLSLFDLASMNVGSAVPSMTTRVLNDLNIVIPSNHALYEFDRLATDFFNHTNALIKQNSCLSKLRDTLLPKLMSGELRIPDAEKLVADI
ncbi:restriction endonuclease subunit S [uncultured Psychrobacter sp.]|uniref:restriction endonuclease subunit S n=1 Tax=uncultured Psychrobacter sp. TaxID=259303 RepID=UPI0025957B5A|nr:restriction endonuclease subunit S [uncultured Psychrobacter sp.]